MRSFYKDLENVMARLESKWQKQNYSTDLFAEIAHEETENFDFSPLGEIKNQMKLLEMPGVRVQQAPSTFSDLYVQAFHNGRFMVEILNWWGGHVNVHDHDFAAVQFQLKGDALNTEYDFKTSREVGALRFGELKLKSAEIWKQGDRSVVQPGRDHAHSVFHLGQPTTSLLVRTTATYRYGAQSNYFPGLAAHYYVSNALQRKKLTALSLMARCDQRDFSETFNHFLFTQSLSENFFMMLKLGPLLFEDRFVGLVTDYARQNDDQATVVHNVIINNGIDFFKNQVNSIDGLTQTERLAGFAVAAAHNYTGFKALEDSPQIYNFSGQLRSELKSFLNKMNDENRMLAHQYLNVFGLLGLLNETL